MLRFCTFVSPEVNTSGIKGLKSHSAPPKERGNHLHARLELSPPRGTGVTLEQLHQSHNQPGRVWDPGWLWASPCQENHWAQPWAAASP